MKILITGGAGFVGSNLALNLKKEYPNYEIMVFDNLKRRGSESNLQRFKALDIKFIHGDVRFEKDLEGIAFDLLIEASAEPSVLAGKDGGRKYLIDTNLNGCINCLEATLKQDAKVIFLSTSRVYPMQVINALNYTQEATRYTLAKNDKLGVTKRGFNEELSLKGSRTLYGATKLSAEYMIDEYTNMFGLDAVINRCGVIAGAGQFGKVDQGVVTLWVANYFFNKPLSIFGNGKQVRDILNINDLYDLINMQIHHFDSFKNQNFNVGGGLSSSVSLLELDKICKDLINDKNVDFKSLRELDIKYYVTDNSKINKLGWSPKRSVDDTVQEIFSWLKENEKELKWIFA